MIDALLILGALSLLIGVSVWLLFRADEQMVAASAPSKVENTHPENKIYVYPTTGIGLADKSTSVFKREQPPMVTVRFLNERGRTIGQLEIPAARRKPLLVLEKLGARHVCQASHQEPDGTWIYRRSGRE